MPKVSVIIPTYNDKKHIGKCIKSVTSGMTNEEKNDVEIVVVDDGSTDKSVDELEKLASKCKEKMIIIEATHNGVGAARNRGLDIASGKYIRFLDSADTLVPGTLKKMCNIAEDYNAALVRGNYNYFFGPIKFVDKNNWSEKPLDKGLIDLRANKDQLVTEYPNLGNKLFSREIIGNSRFPEAEKWEDLGFVPAVMAKSDAMFNMDESVYNCRVRANTTVKDFVVPIPNIYDIIKDLDYLKQEMMSQGTMVDYAEQMESLYIVHTLYRVENVMTWQFFSSSNKKIIISSLLAKLDMECPGWENNRMLALYRTKKPGFDKHMKKLYKFIYNEYREEKDSSIIEPVIGAAFIKIR